MRCTRPTNAFIDAVDRRVTEQWIAAVTDPERGESVRRMLAVHWCQDTPASELAEQHRRLREIEARIGGADTARFLDGTLDAQRHRRVVSELHHQADTLRVLIGRRNIDTHSLTDPDVVRDRFTAASIEERRRLLRYAWARVTVRKSPQRGGSFRHDRIAYVPAAPLPQLSDHDVAPEC